MAGRAVLIAWIGHVMVRCLGRNAGALPSEIPRAVVTLQAQSKYHRAPQQTRICRAVRSVARLASVHANPEMFEDEGPALIGMAIKTRLFVRPRLL